MSFILFFHLILRQTPSLTRDSKLSQSEVLKKADQMIHERLKQFKRGLMTDLIQEYHADVQVWGNLLAREKAQDDARSSGREEDASRSGQG